MPQKGETNLSAEEKEQLSKIMLERYLDGLSIDDIAKEFQVSRWQAKECLRVNPQRWEEAKTIRAEQLASEGLRIVDEADPVTASLARGRAQYRQWLASMLSREYSPKQELDIKGQISVTPVIEIAHANPQVIDITDIKTIEDNSTIEKDK